MDLDLIHGLVSTHLFMFYHILSLSRNLYENMKVEVGNKSPMEVWNEAITEALKIVKSFK